jgi:hypothetical protein
MAETRSGPDRISSSKQLGDKGNACRGDRDWHRRQCRGLDSLETLLPSRPTTASYAPAVYRAGGGLALLIYEVRNTFGEVHPYVLPVREGDVTAAGVRQEQDKLFYVSPFVGMAMRYRFRISPPGEQVKLRILVTDGGGRLLAATFIDRHRALSTRAPLQAVVALPLVTAKIVAAIHWEALRLWLKGARLVARPIAAGTKPTDAANSGLASGENQAYIS